MSYVAETHAKRKLISALRINPPGVMRGFGHLLSECMQQGLLLSPDQ